MLCDCGRTIVQPARGRRRSKCEECSPPDRRQRTDKLAPVAGQVLGMPQRSSAENPDSLAEQTRLALREVGRESSWQGVAAIKAAKLIDGGQYTAQGAAALFKAHREALAVAMEGAGRKADVIDLIFGEA